MHRYSLSSSFGARLAPFSARSFLVHRRNICGSCEAVDRRGTRTKYEAGAHLPRFSLACQLRVPLSASPTLSAASSSSSSFCLASWSSSLLRRDVLLCLYRSVSYFLRTLPLRWFFSRPLLSLSLVTYAPLFSSFSPPSRHPLSAGFDLSSSHCRSRANFLHSSRSVLARSTFPSQLLRSGRAVVRARDVTLRFSCLFGEITRQHLVVVRYDEKYYCVIMSPLPSSCDDLDRSSSRRACTRRANLLLRSFGAVFTARLRLSRLITETGGWNIINIIPTATLRRYIARLPAECLPLD